MRTHLYKIALFGLVLAGCAQPPPRPFDVEVRALNDEGEPLRGVGVKINGKEAGVTDGSGVLILRRHEAEGEHLSVTADPPRGYRLAGELRPLVLRRIARMVSGAMRELPTEYVIRFGALRRKYAVLVDVGEPDLPVEVFGAEQAVTNSRGVASFLYEGSPGDELAVRVSCEKNPELVPQVIAGNFMLAPRSEAYLVQGRFVPKPKTQARPKVVRVHIIKPKRLQ
jgi:hypothetical protein